MSFIRSMAAGLALILGVGAVQASPPQQDWDLKGQFTYVFQDKPAFRAAYTLPGFNSLPPARALSHSLTATAYLGLRPWDGGEFYYNEEMVLGVPFSNLTGLAGVPNAELQKAAGPKPLFYRPRVFLRQTWGLGGGGEEIESAINQLAGTVDRRRLTLTLGNFSLVDIFDVNSFAHDGRRDFFNWANVAHGAYDYAADVRGYTWGAALELRLDEWALRAGRSLVPRQSNGLELNFSIMNFHGDQIEIERAHEIGGQPGRLRLLAFRNVALMGRFSDALAYAAANGGTPDVANVRGPAVKRGAGASFEQNVAQDVALFGRVSANDGRSEMFSYTEIERAAQIGASVTGTRWGRERDVVALALTRNGLSQAHRNYQAAGGTGFLIGDGRLNYRPEQIVEGYYSLALGRSTWLSFDYQHFANPAYNADRGPVTIWGLRLHGEF